MMLLVCSSDLQKAMHVQLEPESESDSDSLHRWYGQTFYFGKRNCVVVMHSATWFSLVLWGLNAEDYAALPENLLRYIRQFLESYHVSEEMIATYLADCGTVTLAKNKSRRDISHLNQLSMDLKFCCKSTSDLSRRELLQISCSRKLNQTMHGNDNESGYKRFFKLLQEQYPNTVFDVQMYHLKITLHFPDFEISRVLRVPEYATFLQLHLMIQRSFNWLDYHLYEFTVIGDTGKSEKIIFPKMPDETGDMWKRPVPTAFDEDCTVGEIFSQAKEVLYVYDMGGLWEHRIQLLEVTQERCDTTPTCLEAIGKAPPEDCGGVDGYRRLLAGKSDMTEWVNALHWEDQTAEGISQTLKTWG